MLNDNTTHYPVYLLYLVYHIRPVIGRCFDGADLTLLFKVEFKIECTGASCFSKILSIVSFTGDVLVGCYSSFSFFLDLCFLCLCGFSFSFEMSSLCVALTDSPVGFSFL